MTTIFIVILFLLQLIGFYFLALLYTKVSKFDDLEKKQRKLMDEMDDSIGAYLAELKDENERLIERLSEREAQKVANEREVDAVLEKSEAVSIAEEPQSKLRVSTPKMPVNLALKSYSAALATQESILHKPTEPETVDDRTRAIQLHNAGVSIEEIAKKLGKGRTEIELILKFK